MVAECAVSCPWRVVKDRLRVREGSWCVLWCGGGRQSFRRRGRVVVKAVQRAGLFVLLRLRRAGLFGEQFRAGLARACVDSPEGAADAAGPAGGGGGPAACPGVCGEEVIGAKVTGRRWQLVLACPVNRFAPLPGYVRLLVRLIGVMRRIGGPIGYRIDRTVPIHRGNRGNPSDGVPFTRSFWGL
jgi:hypothetical protein